MAAAPSPPQRTAKPRVTLPYPLLPAPKTTTSGEDADDDIERFLRPRTDENMCIKKGSKRTRWTALRLESKGSAEGVYDDLWGTLGKEGKRWLSVAKHGGVLWALLYKGDDGEVDMTNLSPKATPYDVQEVTAGGPASRKALAEFARAWLGNAQEATSNFTVQTEEEQQAEALEAFEDCRSLSDKDFYLSIAAAKLNGSSPRAQVVKRISPELKSLRAVDKKQQKVVNEVLQDPCFQAVKPVGLHMPTDFVGVESWLGQTWSPEGGAQTMTFLHWLNSPEHLERTAVIYSDSGSGKTAVLNGAARTLAMRYQDRPYYLCSGTVNGLRSAHRKGLLKQGVPRIIEDYVPKGNPNGNRQPLAEYLVNLLNVKDGGTIDLPGGSQLALPAAAPQIISTNREFSAWIKKFRSFPIELQHAISKRIVFFTLPDSPLVKAEMRKRRQEDMASMAAAGLERERKFLRLCGREDASTATTPSEAGSAGVTPSSDGSQMGEAVQLARELHAGEPDEELPEQAEDTALGMAEPAPKRRKEASARAAAEVPLAPTHCADCSRDGGAPELEQTPSAESAAADNTPTGDCDLTSAAGSSEDEEEEEDLPPDDQVEGLLPGGEEDCLPAGAQAEAAYPDFTVAIPSYGRADGLHEKTYARLPFSPKRLASRDLEELNAYLEWDGMVPDKFGDNDAELQREMLDWYRGEI